MLRIRQYAFKTKYGAWSTSAPALFLISGKERETSKYSIECRTLEAIGSCPKSLAMEIRKWEDKQLMHALNRPAPSRPLLLLHIRYM